MDCVIYSQALNLYLKHFDFADYDCLLTSDIKSALKTRVEMANYIVSLLDNTLYGKEYKFLVKVL